MGSSIVGNQQKHLSLSLLQNREFIPRETRNQYNNTLFLIAETAQSGQILGNKSIF